MTVTAILSVLVLVVGLLLYLLPLKNGKLTDIGRISFAIGLLVTLLSFASLVVRTGWRP